MFSLYKGVNLKNGFWKNTFFPLASAWRVPYIIATYLGMHVALVQRLSESLSAIFGRAAALGCDDTGHVFYAGKNSCHGLAHDLSIAQANILDFSGQEDLRKHCRWNVIAAKWVWVHRVSFNYPACKKRIPIFMLAWNHGISLIQDHFPFDPHDIDLFGIIDPLIRIVVCIFYK